VLSVGTHTETEEVLVVYRSLDDPELIWVRPLQMFTSEVERPGGPSPRFAREDDGRGPVALEALRWMLSKVPPVGNALRRSSLGLGLSKGPVGLRRTH
jgi:hypothetical protein